MKRSYQLMQIYQIERDYGRHKQKLKSIQHIDTHKKPSFSSRNLCSHSTYKKSHSLANSFLSKQTYKKIQKENDFLYKTLIKENERKPQITIKQNPQTDSSKSLLRNTSLTMKISRIKQENSKIKKKIQTARSTYEQFRKSSTSMSLTKKKDNEKENEELKRFLQNQFRIKPTVLFPQVNKTKSIEKSKLSQSEINKLLPKFYQKQLIKTLNSRNRSKIQKDSSQIINQF